MSLTLCLWMPFNRVFAFIIVILTLNINAASAELTKDDRRIFVSAFMNNMIDIGKYNKETWNEALRPYYSTTLLELKRVPLDATPNIYSSLEEFTIVGVNNETVDVRLGKDDKYIRFGVIEEKGNPKLTPGKLNNNSNYFDIGIATIIGEYSLLSLKKASSNSKSIKHVDAFIKDLWKHDYWSNWENAQMFRKYISPTFIDANKIDITRASLYGNLPFKSDIGGIIFHGREGNVVVASATDGSSDVYFKLDHQNKFIPRLTEDKDVIANHLVVMH